MKGEKRFQITFLTLCLLLASASGIAAGQNLPKPNDCPAELSGLAENLFKDPAFNSILDQLANLVMDYEHGDETSPTKRLRHSLIEQKSSELHDLLVKMGFGGTHLDKIKALINLKINAMRNGDKDAAELKVIEEEKQARSAEDQIIQKISFDWSKTEFGKKLYAQGFSTGGSSFAKGQWSTDGKYFVVLVGGTRAEVIDASTGETLGRIRLKGSSFSSDDLAFLPTFENSTSGAIIYSNPYGSTQGAYKVTIADFVKNPSADSYIDDPKNLTTKIALPAHTKYDHLNVKFHALPEVKNGTSLLTPDGRYRILSHREDDPANQFITLKRSVGIYDLRDQTQKYLIDDKAPNPERNANVALALSPDGKKLIESIGDEGVIWSFETGELLHRFKYEKHKGVLYPVWSPDSQFFISAVTEDYKGRIEVWSAEGLLLQTFPVGYGISDLVYNPITHQIAFSCFLGGSTGIAVLDGTVTFDGAHHEP